MAERSPFPSERELLDAREEEFELRMYGPMPVRVQSYDPDLQVADLVPLVRQQVPQPDGSYVMEDLPVLPCVPVCFPRAGEWFLSFPIAEGDTGLAVICQGAIGHWRVGSGDITDPGDLRRHHLSHAVFLPVGLVPRVRKLTRTGAAGTSAPPESRPTGVVLGRDTASGPRILLKADGSLEIETGGATVARVEPNPSVPSNFTVHLGASSAAAFVALASHVDARLSALVTAFNAHTHPVSGAATGVPATPAAAPATVAARRVMAT